jgi:menaquinone-dependent protoporphyrinogen IX oxidase
MNIEYFHASKHGNGAEVASYFSEVMQATGSTVNVHDVRETDPTEIPDADLYVFSSPGRLGKPIGRMRRFLARAPLRRGAEYALLTTEAAPRPDKQTGRIPSAEEITEHQRVRPIMDEILAGKGLIKVGEQPILVTGVKGPLEAGWHEKVKAFANGLG